MLFRLRDVRNSAWVLASSHDHDDQHDADTGPGRRLPDGGGERARRPSGTSSAVDRGGPAGLGDVVVSLMVTSPPRSAARRATHSAALVPSQRLKVSGTGCAVAAVLDLRAELGRLVAHPPLVGVVGGGDRAVLDRLMPSGVPLIPKIITS